MSKFWKVFFKISRKDLILQLVVSFLIVLTFSSLLILPNYIIGHQVGTYYAKEENYLRVESSVSSFNITNAMNYQRFAKDLTIEHLVYRKSLIYLEVANNAAINQTGTVVIDLGCTNNVQSSHDMEGSMTNIKNGYLRVPCGLSSVSLLKSFLESSSLTEVKLISYFQYKPDVLYRKIGFQTNMKQVRTSLQQQFASLSILQGSVMRIIIPEPHILLSKEIDLIEILFRYIQVLLMVLIPYIVDLLAKFQLESYQDLETLLEYRGYESIRNMIFTTSMLVDGLSFMISTTFLNYVVSFYSVLRGVDWLLLCLLGLVFIFFRYHHCYEQEETDVSDILPKLHLDNLWIIVFLLSFTLILSTLRYIVFDLFNPDLQQLIIVLNQVLWLLLVVIAVIITFYVISSKPGNNIGIKPYVNKVLVHKPAYKSITNILAILLWCLVLIAVVNTTTMYQFETSTHQYYNNFNVDITKTQLNINQHLQELNITGVETVMPLLVQNSQNGIIIIFLDYNTVNEQIFNKPAEHLQNDTYYASSKIQELLDVQHINEISISYSGINVRRNLVVQPQLDFFVSKYGPHIILAPMDLSIQGNLIPQRVFYKLQDKKVDDFTQRMLDIDSGITIHSTKFPEFSHSIEQLKLVVIVVFIPILVIYLFFILSTYQELFLKLRFFVFSWFDLFKLTITTLGVKLLILSNIVGLSAVLGFALLNHSIGLDYFLRVCVDIIVVNTILLSISFFLSYILLIRKLKVT